AIGATASFSVVAAGSHPFSYQWSFNGTNLMGANNSTLTLTNVQLSSAGSYAVVVTNAYGSVISSNAVLTASIAACAPMQPGLVSWWAAEGNALDWLRTNNGVLQGGAGFASGEV